MKPFKILINMYEMRCKIIKSIVFAICLSALITESYYLYFDYKDYQTVVTVNIERPSLVDKGEARTATSQILIKFGQ